MGVESNTGVRGQGVWGARSIADGRCWGSNRQRGEKGEKGKFCRAMKSRNERLEAGGVGGVGGALEIPSRERASRMCVFAFLLWLRFAIKI